MAAQAITLALRLVLPALGEIAIGIGGILATWYGTRALTEQLTEYLSANAQRKRDILNLLPKTIEDALTSPAVVADMTFYGIDKYMVRYAISQAVQTELAKLNIPTNLPTFATTQAALDYWGQQYNYYLQGLMTDEYFNAVTNWCNAEISRIALAAAAAPPAVPPSGVPAGAVYQPGTILYANFFGWYSIIMSVTLVNGVITYQLYVINIKQTQTYTQAQLVAMGLAVVTSVPLADPAAANAQIAALNTQIAALNLQAVSLTQDLSNALAALASSARVVTVGAPDVTVNAGDITVQAAPAPSVWVTPTLGVAGIEGLLGALPMTLTQSLVGALTASAGGMSHAAALGRNACYGSTTAALLGNMLPTALGVFSMRALQSDVGIGGWIKDRATDWIDSHVDPRKYVHVDTIDDLVDNASKRLREAMSFGLQAHMWAVTAESNFVLKNLGLGQVAGAMADLADFKRVAQATIGAVEVAALSTPAKLLANYQLRPNIPGMGDLEEMYAKKEIPLSAPAGKPSLSHSLALQGFSDDWINVFSEYLWKDPRLGEIIRIGQFFSPELVPALARPDARTAEWLRNAGVAPQYIDSSDWYYAWRAAKGGYDPRDVSILVETAKRATARREQTLFLDGVTRMARDGYITTERSQELILEAWKFSNPIAARLRAIELQKDYKLLSETRSVIVMAMARGLITREEARTQLTELGFDDQRVELEVLKATLGMLPGMRLEISRPEEVLEEAGMEAE